MAERSEWREVWLRSMPNATGGDWKRTADLTFDDIRASLPALQEAEHDAAALRDSVAAAWHDRVPPDHPMPSRPRPWTIGDVFDAVTGRGSALAWDDDLPVYAEIARAAQLKVAGSLFYSRLEGDDLAYATRVLDRWVEVEHLGVLPDVGFAASHLDLLAVPIRPEAVMAWTTSSGQGTDSPV